jgi:hypothetical protein
MRPERPGKVQTLRTENAHETILPSEAASAASRTRALIPSIYGPSETRSFGTHVHLSAPTPKIN